MGIFPDFSGGSNFFDFIPRLLGINQANAQPVNQQQMPSMPPPQFGPLGPIERIPEAMGGLFNSGNLVRGAFNAANTLLTGARTDPSSIASNNARIMYHNLIAQGLDHNQALMAIMNPKVGEAAGTELMKGTINPDMQIAPDGSIIIKRPYGKISHQGGVPISERMPDIVDAQGNKTFGGWGVKPSLNNPQGAVVNPYTRQANQNIQNDPTMTVSPRQVEIANGPPVTELSPEAKSELERRGLGNAAVSEDYRTAGRKATNKLQVLSRLSQLSDKAFEGTGGPGQLYIRSLLTSFGMSPSPKATASEELVALTNKLTREELGSLGAGISNADVAFIKAINPDLATTAAGRKEVIATLTAISRREQEVAKMAENWLMKNKSIRGFDVALAQWAEQNPIFNFNDRFNPANSSGGTLPAPPKGFVVQ